MVTTGVSKLSFTYLIFVDLQLEINGYNDVLSHKLLNPRTAYATLSPSGAGNAGVYHSTPNQW